MENDVEANGIVGMYWCIGGALMRRLEGLGIKLRFRSRDLGLRS